MLAFQISDHDSPPTLSEIECPDPGPGQISVKIAACGLNFADLLIAEGTYQDMPPLPATLGMELAGTIGALGPGVEGPAPGTRVAIFTGQGGLAQQGVFPAERAVSIPETMSFLDAAAFPIAYGTSHLALSRRARLQVGETLLVLGAAGGVGLTAVELGRMMGARVIACARGADKLAAAEKAGAEHLIDSNTGDLRTEVKALGGADVVFDPVGGELATEALRTLNPEGRLLSIGFASGKVPKFATNHLLVKNLDVIGYYWGGYMSFAPQVIGDSLSRLFSWYANGALRPHVSHVLPLARAAEGLDLLRSRKSTGKVVIEIP